MGDTGPPLGGSFRLGKSSSECPACLDRAGAVDSGLTGCSEVTETLHVDSCVSFSVWPRGRSSLHVSSPIGHPKLLTGWFTDAANRSSVPGGSLQVSCQLQGPSCGPPCCALECLCDWATFAATIPGTSIPRSSPHSAP